METEKEWHIMPGDEACPRQSGPVGKGANSTMHIKNKAKTRVRALAFYLLLAAVMSVGCFAEPLNRLFPLPMGGKGYAAIVLLIFAILSWCLQLAPIAVTALAVVALVPFTGLTDFASAVKAGFGDSTFTFFLGVLLLSAAFQKTPLGQRIALEIFRVFGRSPRRVLLGLMLAGTLLAMWVTEVAAAAILYPLALSIVEQSRSRPDAVPLARTLMIGVAWGPAFGGVATPIATGANLVAVTYLEQYGGITIGFGEWMAVGVPIALTLLAAGWLLLARELPKDAPPLELIGELAPISRSEMLLIADFALAIFLWIMGERIGLSSHHVALMAGLLLFFPGIEVLDWKDAAHTISWDSIILVCAGIVLGDVLYQNGVAEWMAGLLFVPVLLRQGLFLTGAYIVLTVSVLKILFSSNTVAGVILVPIMITLAGQQGASAWAFVAPCIFSSALAFILITSSPVNVIPYASGCFTPGDMARRGVVMTLLAAVIIAFWLFVLQVC